MFKVPSGGRTTLVLMAWDANLPIVFFAGYGALLSGNPFALLRQHPWLLVSMFAFPAAYALAGSYCERARLCSPEAVLRTVAATLVVTSLIGGGFLLLGDPDGARGTFTALTFTMIAGGVPLRALGMLKSRNIPHGKTALVVGAAADGCAVIDCTLREPRLRVRVVGFIDDDPLKKNFQYKGIAVIGNGLNLEETAVQNGVNLVVNAVSGPQSAGLIRSLVRLKVSGVEVVEMPSFIERATGQCPIRRVEDAWFLYNQGFQGIPGVPPPLWKRGTDLIAALLGIAISLPLFVIVLLMIKLESRGSAFSLHQRIGKGEHPFSLFKFRTRLTGAHASPGSGITHVPESRLTRIGRWLRRAHLDEVPQLGNVLNGEMSLVGPRADSSLQVEKLKAAIPCYGLRFAIKPGLVGWAQVQKGPRGTNGDAALENLKYDLYYLKNMSPLLDVIIVRKALRAVIFTRREA